MNGRMSRRDFLECAAAYTAVLTGVTSVLGAAEKVPPRAAASGSQPGLTRMPASARKLPMAPNLRYGPPTYDRSLQPVRVLTRWTPHDRRFLLHQRDYSGTAGRAGNFLVVTLRNESEGAAFDTVVEMFALTVGRKPGERPRVLKFDRFAQMVEDVQSNRSQDFAFQITWPTDWPGDLGPLHYESVRDVTFEHSYTARFWHPVFDPAPGAYVAADRHFSSYRISGPREPRFIRGRHVPLRR